MTNVLVKRINKWVFKEFPVNKYGKHVTDLNDSIQNHNETENIKHRINLQIPPADAEVLIKVKRRANQLDSAMNVCGIKFGWSSIIGFLPAIGDVLDVFMALMIMNTAMEVSPGKDRDRLKRTMWKNIIFDLLVGLFPVLGDVVDLFFRANIRNAIALEKMLNNRLNILNEKKKTDIIISQSQ